jgi:hypothetical protein
VGIRIVKPGTAAHQAVQELLPWYVTNTLKNDEMVSVRKHLQTCRECQGDVEWQRRLRAISSQPDTPVDVEQMFAKLLPRLEVTRRGAQHRTFRTFRMLSEFPRRVLRWKPSRIWWALAGQAAIVAAFAIVLVPPYGGPASFHGLGNRGNATGSAIGNAVVMFRPDTTEAEMRRVLQKNGARIVNGPTVTDAYVIVVPNGQQAKAVDALRSERSVALAELLESGGGR